MQARRIHRACMVRCRSEEHTSELQSLTNLVCRLLLEKKKIYVAERTLTSVPFMNGHRARRALSSVRCTWLWVVRARVASPTERISSTVGGIVCELSPD